MADSFNSNNNYGDWLSRPNMYRGPVRDRFKWTVITILLIILGFVFIFMPEIIKVLTNLFLFRRL